MQDHAIKTKCSTLIFPWLPPYLSTPKPDKRSSPGIRRRLVNNMHDQQLPTDILHTTINSIHFFTQSSSPFLLTYHLRLPLLITVEIGSTPSSLLNSSLVLMSFMETPHIHIIICISALLKFNPTLTSNELVSLHKSCCFWRNWHTLDISSPAGELWISHCIAM